MKKNTTSKATKATKEKASAPARATLKWMAAGDILAGSKEDEKGNTHLELVEPQGGLPICTLHIYPTNYAFDNGVIELFGFSIRVQIRSGKNGMFISFPQEKGKDGAYYDRVTCFDKNFHSMIKEVLGALYDDQGSAEE